MARKKHDEVPVISAPPAPEATTPAEPPKERSEEFVTKVERIPLWKKWDTEALQNKRDVMGAREFERQFRQRPMADTDLIFQTINWDKVLDRDRVMPDHVAQGDYWAKLPRDCGVDLAISEGGKGAYFVILGVAITSDWHRWILTIHFSRGQGFGSQIGSIVEHHDRFGFDVVNVENNAYQNSIVRHLQEEGMTGRVPIKGYTTGSVSKRDLEVGLPGMATEWEQSRWHIPYGDARSRRMADFLIEELKAYPSPGFHDDGVMAAFFAREARRMVTRPKAQIIMLRF